MPSAKRSKAAAKKSKSKKSKSKKELRGQDNDGVEFVTGRRGMLDLVDHDGEGSTSGSEVEHEIGGSGGEEGGEGDDGETVKAEDETITLRSNAAGVDDAPFSPQDQSQSQKGKQPKRTQTRKMAKVHFAPIPPASESAIMQSLSSYNTPYMKEMYKRREAIRRQVSGEPEPEPEPEQLQEYGLNQSSLEGQGQDRNGPDVFPHPRLPGNIHRLSRCTHGWEELQQIRYSSGPGPLSSEAMMKGIAAARGMGRRCQDGTCGDAESGMPMPPPGTWSRIQDRGKDREEGHGMPLNTNFGWRSSGVPGEQNTEFRSMANFQSSGYFCLECTPGISSRNAERFNPSHPLRMQELFLQQGGSIHVAGKACDHPLAVMTRPDCSRYHIQVHTHDDLGMSDYLPRCDNCGKKFDLDAGNSPPEDNGNAQLRFRHPCDMHRPHLPISEMRPDVNAWLRCIPHLGASPSYASILAIPPSYVDLELDLVDLVELAETIGHEDMRITMPDSAYLPRNPPLLLRAKCILERTGKQLAIYIAHHRMRLETDVAMVALGRTPRQTGVDLDQTRLLGSSEHRELSISCIEVPHSGKKTFVLHCKVPGPIFVFPPNLSNARCPGMEWTNAAYQMPFSGSETRSKFLLRELDHHTLPRWSFAHYSSACGECACPEAEAEPERTDCTSPDPSSESLDDRYQPDQHIKTLRHVQSYGHSSASRHSSPQSASSTESGEAPASNSNAGRFRWGDANLTLPEDDPVSSSGAYNANQDLDANNSMSNLDFMTLAGGGLHIHNLGAGSDLQAVLSAALGVCQTTSTPDVEPDGARIQLLDADHIEELPSTDVVTRQSTPVANFPQSRPSFARKKNKRKPKAAKVAVSMDSPPAEQFKLKERLEKLAHRRKIEATIHDKQRAINSSAGPSDDADQQQYDFVLSKCRLMEEQTSIDSLFALDVPLLGPKTSLISYNYCQSSFATAVRYGGTMAKGHTVYEMLESRKQEVALKEWKITWRTNSKAHGLVLRRLYDTVTSTSPAFFGPSPKFVGQMAQALEGTQKPCVLANALEVLVRTIASDRKVIQGLAQHLLNIISALDRAFEECDDVRVRRGWASLERDRVRGIRDLQWQAILDGSLDNRIASQIKDGLVLAGHMKHLYMLGQYEGVENLRFDSAASNYLSLLQDSGLPQDEATAMLLGIRDLDHNKTLFTQFLQGPEGCSDIGTSDQQPPQFPARPYSFSNVIERRSEDLENAKRIDHKRAERLFFCEKGGAEIAGTTDGQQTPGSQSAQESLSSKGDDQPRSPKPRAAFKLRGKLRRVYAKLLMLDNSRFATFAPLVILHLAELLLRYCNDVPAALRTMLHDGGSESGGLLENEIPAPLCDVTWADGEDMMIVGLVAQSMLHKVLAMKPQEKERISGPRFTSARVKRISICSDCGNEFRGKTCRPCSDLRVEVRLASARNGQDSDSSSEESGDTPESVETVARAENNQNSGAPLEALRNPLEATSAKEVATGGKVFMPASSASETPADKGPNRSNRNESSPLLGSQTADAESAGIPPTFRVVDGGVRFGPGNDDISNAAPPTESRRKKRKPRKKAAVDRIDPEELQSQDQMGFLSNAESGTPISIVQDADGVFEVDSQPTSRSWQIGSIDMTPSKSAASCVTSSTDPDHSVLRTPAPSRAQVYTPPVTVARTISQAELEAELGIMSTPTAKPNLGALAGEQMDQLNLKFDIEASPRMETALIGRRITVGQLMAVPEDEQANDSDVITAPIRRLCSQRSASFSATASEQLRQHSSLVADHHPELSLATYSEHWDAFLGEWQERASANVSPPESVVVEHPAPKPKDSNASAIQAMQIPPSLQRPNSLAAPVKPSDNSSSQQTSPDLDVVTAEDPLAGYVPPTSRVVSVKVNPSPTPPSTPGDAAIATAAWDSTAPASGSSTVASAWEKIRQQREALQQEKHEQRSEAAPTSQIGLQYPPGLPGSRRKDSFAAKLPGEKILDTPVQGQMHDAMALGVHPVGVRNRGKGKVPGQGGRHSSGQDLPNVAAGDGSGGRRGGKSGSCELQQPRGRITQRSRGHYQGRWKAEETATSTKGPADDGW